MLATSTSRMKSVMVLDIGKFYWVIPAPALTAPDDWQDGLQPARFIGRDPTTCKLLWSVMGLDGVSDWPMLWIGNKVKEPAHEIPLCSTR
jgi:hypothetical protein